MADVQRLLLLFVTMVTVQLTFCQNHDDWIKTVHNVEDPVTLNCTEHCDSAEANGCHPRVEIPSEFTEIRSWMGPAPNLYVWDVRRNESHIIITNISQTECPSCEILSGGFQFRINKFDPTRHIGIYHCMLYNDTTEKYYLVKWGVNMRGPYFEDLLEKYELNIIYGSSAFGAFMVVAVTIVLVYRYRWVPDEDNNKQSPLATSQNNYGTSISSGVYGVESTIYQNVGDGKVNQAFEDESPPQCNGINAEVEVHNQFSTNEDKARPGTSSSSSSDGGSVRKRDMPHPPTPHHTATTQFNFDEETKF